MKKDATFSFSLLLVFTISLCLFGKKTIAQNCPHPNSYLKLEGNNISAPISNRGDLFFDWEAGGFTLVGDSDLMIKSTIFGGGLWLGAKDTTGQLKLVSYSRRNSEFRYTTGPIINEGGEFSFPCEDYQKVWEVLGFEILNHLADFEDDGIIENPISNIYSYPALGNPHFENFNGFSLPDAPHGYAPFHDENNDGLYNPDDGDFPLPSAVHESRIPNHLIWSIFNDGGINENSTQGEPLYAEVQLTAWSFDCTEDGLLDNTIFTSYKITNLGNEDLDSLVMGMLVNFDLGCHTDDYLGSAPELNSYYAYNEDLLDGTTGCVCNAGVATFCDTPPAQAVTFLNQEMSAFTYYNSSFTDSLPFMFEPETSQEFYNFLIGRWRDGTPFTVGGEGYGGTEPTNFAFSDNPNDSTGWSMVTVEPTYADRQAIGSVSIGNFAKGESFTVDLAFSLHIDETLDHLEIVDKMYEQIPSLQQMYDDGFVDGCTPDICVEDCVYAGDTNKDSIVNTFDILQIGLAFGENGTARNRPLIFRPYFSENWNTMVDGTDLKHTDADGNGSISSSDFYFTTFAFGRSYKQAPVTDVYPIGDELSLQLLDPNAGLKEVEVVLNQSEEIYGLAFTMEYDTTYLETVFSTVQRIWEDQTVDNFTILEPQNTTGEVFYATVKVDGQNGLTSLGVFANVRLIPRDIDYELVQTAVRLKNIKAILNDGTVLDYGASNNLIIEITNPNGNGVLLNDEGLEKNTVSIFPNPAFDFLNIHFEKSTKASFTVFDLYGNVLLQKKESTQEHAQIPISDFPQEIYFLKIQMDGKEVVQKFLKH